MKKIWSPWMTGKAEMPTLKETAKEEEADMIVMNSRGARVHTWMIGSVTREMVEKSEATVLAAK